LAFEPQCTDYGELIGACAEIERPIGSISTVGPNVSSSQAWRQGVSFACSQFSWVDLDLYVNDVVIEILNKAQAAALLCSIGCTTCPVIGWDGG